MGRYHAKNDTTLKHIKCLFVIHEIKLFCTLFILHHSFYTIYFRSFFRRSPVWYPPEECHLEECHLKKCHLKKCQPKD